MRKLLFIAVVFILPLMFMLGACGGHQQQHDQSGGKNTDYQEQLLDANKAAVKTEAQQIRDYIRRHRWKMQETGTGLLYSIYKKGTGPAAETGRIATIQYDVSLINGREIYNSDQLGPLQFTIGKGGVPSGLEEGILLMHVGDRAKFVIPSHLAYGLLGDQNKVPPKATLIYDVKLTNIK